MIRWMPLVLVGSLAAQEPAALDEAAFERLHAALQPADDDAWQSIPWRLDLGAARAEAIAEGKPLFLWSMNGHPLGCT